MRIQFGDELEVLQNGPLINPKTLKGMGISDGATCWGVWMDSRVTRNPEKMKKELEIPHLKVSPLHPSMWPISFQLRVILRDEKGSLHGFLSAIKKLPIEIQFAEYSFTGYEQMELNLLCTFSDMTRWKTDFLDFYITSGFKETLNGHWVKPETKGEVSSKEDAIGNIVQALRISSSQLRDWQKEKRENNNLIYYASPEYDNSLVRRTALEWIGRRMLRETNRSLDGYVDAPPNQ